MAGCPHRRRGGGARRYASGLARRPISDSEWQQLQFDLPIGSDVACEVAHHAPFGFFVTIFTHPDVSAVVLVPDFKRADKAWTDVDDYPAIGSRLLAEVADHVNLSKQVRLRVGAHVVISTPEVEE